MILLEVELSSDKLLVDVLNDVVTGYVVDRKHNKKMVASYPVDVGADKIDNPETPIVVVDTRVPSVVVASAATTTKISSLPSPSSYLPLSISFHIHHVGRIIYKFICIPSVASTTESAETKIIKASKGGGIMVINVKTWATGYSWHNLQHFISVLQHVVSIQNEEKRSIRRRKTR